MPIFDLSTEIFDIPSTIGTTLFGGSSSMIDAKRVPMTFTSTKRLRLINPQFNSSPSDLAAFKVLGTEALELKPATADSKSGKQAEMPVIEMSVNPNSISWRQPKRITKRDTQEGSVFFHFTNSKGQNNDILTLDFRGNTGNLDLDSDKATEGEAKGALGATGENTGAMQKLRIWHNLWALTREQILLDDKTINQFLITYTSAAIPQEIMLVGFFSKNLDWDDSAEKPNSKDYNFSFTVQEVLPDIDDLIRELETFFSSI